MIVHFLLRVSEHSLGLGDEATLLQSNEPLLFAG